MGAFTLRSEDMFSSRRLLTQSALFYFPKLISGFGGFLAFSLLFRVRGAAEYGDFVLIFAYWGIPAILAGDIVGTSGQRLLAEANAQPDGSVKKAFLSIWHIHLLAVLLFGLLGWACLPLANRFVFNNPNLGDHTLLGLVIYFGTASLSFFRYVLRGMGLYWQTLAMDMSESLLRNILWIACCTGYAFGLTLTSAAAISLLVAAAVVYISLIQKGIFPGQGWIEPAHRREVVFQSRAMSLIFLCTYALNNAPLIALNHFHGAETVGLYAALYRIVDISTGPMMSLAYILVPTATGAKLRGEQEVRLLLARSFKMFILFLPFIACLAICRTEVVNLFGLGKYNEAPEIVLAFCIWVLFFNVAALFGPIADFLGYAHQRARIMLVFAIVFSVVALISAQEGSVIQVVWWTTATYSLMVCAYLGLIVHHHSGQFLKNNLTLLGRMCGCLVVAAVVARYALQIPEQSGFRENLQSLVLRSFSFGAIMMGLGYFIVARWENGRFTWR